MRNFSDHEALHRSGAQYRCQCQVSAQSCSHPRPVVRPGSSRSLNRALCYSSGDRPVKPLWRIVWMVTLNESQSATGSAYGFWLALCTKPHAGMIDPLEVPTGHRWPYVGMGVKYPTPGKPGGDSSLDYIFRPDLDLPHPANITRQCLIARPRFPRCDRSSSDFWHC